MSLVKRWNNFRDRLGTWVKVSKDVRTVIAETRLTGGEPRIRRPNYSYPSLMQMGKNNWVLRRIYRAIIQECTREGGGPAKRFHKKCTGCGKEFDTKIEKCDNKECKGGKLRDPRENERLKLVELLRKPNPDHSFKEIIKSTMFYSLALDDFYWSVTWKTEKDENGKETLNAKEMRVLDARFIIPVGDDWGNLGNYEYFCNYCYARYQMIDDKDQYYDIRVERQNKEINPEDWPCPDCGRQLIRTAYVQEIAGKIKARFGKNEIVHGSSSRLLPALFGNSRLITLWHLLQTIQNMDEYNFEVYSLGKVGRLIAFPNTDQQEVTELQKNIDAELQTLKVKNRQTGRWQTSKKIRTMMIGLGEDKPGPPMPIDFMASPKDMQSIEYYHLYLTAACGIYGVTPIFTSSTRFGQSTGPYSRLEIEVMERTTKEEQLNITDPFNNELLPKFGIYDWIYQFNPIEKVDRLRDAQVRNIKMATALTALRCGFDVKIDEEDKLSISGEGDLPEPIRDSKGKPSGSQGEGVAPSGVDHRESRGVDVSDETGGFVEKLTDEMADIITKKIMEKAKKQGMYI